MALQWGVAPEEQVKSLLSINADREGLNVKIPFDMDLQIANGIVEFFFLLFIPRCTGIAFLNEMLDELQKVNEPILKRLLSVFRNSDINSTMLIDKAWVEESKNEKPDWTNCINVLEKTMRFGTQWGATSLSAAAVRGIAIVYEEYLNEPDSAVSLLNKFAQQNGDTFIIKDEMASILFHQKKYNEAFKIWIDILPKWKYSKNDLYASFIFSYRKAGMSAAEIDEWEKAADFFIEGSHYAREMEMTSTFVGYLGDAGYALWKAGKPVETIEVFAEALQNAESLPEPEKNLASFAVRKLLGLNLLWIEHRLSGHPLESLAEPFAGMCSNPDRNEQLTKLPLTPLEISWLHLAQIEYHFRLGREVFECVQARRGQNYPVFRYMLAILGIKHSFLQLSFDDLPDQHQSFINAYYASRDHVNEQKTVWDEVKKTDTQRRIAFLDPATGGEDLFIAALFALVSVGKLSAEIFKAWRDDASIFSDYQKVMGWIDETERILFGSVRDSVVAMMNGAEMWSRRLIASIRVGTAVDVSPNELFYAHVMLASFFLQIEWGENVFDVMADLFARLWQARTNFRAALLMPQVTIPEIRAACSASGPGKRKAAAILLAVANAVSISVPRDVLNRLQNSVNG